MRLLKLTAIAGLGMALLPGCGEGSTKSPDADITLTTCAADPAGGKPKAGGSIVNHTSKPSGYTFRVRFLDASGNEVSAAQGGVARVEPSQTATWNQEGTASAKGPLSCKLANQTRTAVGT
jgi:hypothetical protein